MQRPSLSESILSYRSEQSQFTDLFFLLYLNENFYLFIEKKAL